MLRTLIFCLIFILGSFAVFAQSTAEESLVKWDADQKITWDHFVVKDTSDRFAAECHTFFKANFFLKNDSVFAQIITYLNPLSSWKRPDLDLEDEYNINHEQMHFDITEIHARKIRKQLMDSAFNEQQLEKLYRDNANACRTFQEQYDRETRHSLDRDSQERWNKKINKLLLSLDNYREQAIYIENPWCKMCWKDSPELGGANKNTIHGINKNALENKKRKSP